MRPSDSIGTVTLLPLLLMLGACSSSGDSGGDQAGARSPVEVSTATPRQRAFHTLIEGFGTFTGDARRRKTLTLPQAGQIVDTSITPGHQVRKGQTLLRLATDPNARSTYEQAANALKQARDELTRTKRLHAEKLATNSQLDSARKAAADAKAALDAQTRLGGAQAVTGLRAPADGVVTALDVALGERVAAGAKLIEFTPLQALAAQVGVEPEQARRIRAGMPVTITPVYATDTSSLRGKVAVVADAINPQTQLVDILIDPEPGEEVGLAAGAALSAQIDVAQYTAWAVPRNALLDDDKGHYLYQIEQGKAHRVDVRVRSPGGDPIGVEGKLDAHAPVITLGAYELSDGDAVRAATPSTTTQTANAGDANP
ncbi:MAG: efflux RND transporter periplasmic adaptor subunit [Rhodanobacteraceae bacterium]